MSRFEDFKARDRVAHILIGDGVVTRVDDDGVHVTFDHVRHKKHVEGVYDRRWFALNPEYLFHRTRKGEPS